MSKGECTRWAGKFDAYGYGYICKLNRVLKAHRWVYCEANGCSIDSIKGMVIRHTCDNPACVNPEHLILGTQTQNTDDMAERRRGIKWPDETVALIRHSTLSAVKLSKLTGVPRSTCVAIKSGRLRKKVK